MKVLLVAGLAVVLAGCAATVALLPSSAAVVSAAHTGAAVAAANAAPIVGVGAGVGVVALTTQTDSEKMLGKSRGNLDSCAGFHDRGSESLRGDVERFTYDRNSCRVAITLQAGVVTSVDFSSPSLACRSVIGRCL
ncbi:MAG: hypothetical protein HY017_06610 [Betaproteobacteria bacterium]|nr:hypothetical protein [Betaproteobacteria bacterium]